MNATKIIIQTKKAGFRYRLYPENKEAKKLVKDLRSETFSLDQIKEISKNKNLDIVILSYYGDSMTVNEYITTRR